MRPCVCPRYDHSPRLLTAAPAAASAFPQARPALHRQHPRDKRIGKQILPHTHLGCPGDSWPDGIQRLVHRNAGQRQPYGNRHCRQRHQHRGIHTARLRNHPLRRTLPPARNGLQRHRHRHRHRSVHRPAARLLHLPAALPPPAIPPGAAKRSRKNCAETPCRFPWLADLPLLPYRRGPDGKVAVLHRGIYRIYGHFQLLRRLADSSVFDNDETADDFLIFHGRICLCRRGNDRALHRGGECSGDAFYGEVDLRVELFAGCTLYDPLCIRRRTAPEDDDFG